MPTRVRFPKANLLLLLEGDLTPLGDRAWALVYPKPDPRLALDFDEAGHWTARMPGANAVAGEEPLLVRPAPNPQESFRLVVTLDFSPTPSAGQPPTYRIIDGSVRFPIRSATDEPFPSIVNTDSHLWLTAEGVVLGVNPYLVLPSVSLFDDRNEIFALFRWQPSENPGGKGQWWWRLLPAWPTRSSSSAPQLVDSLRSMFTPIASALRLEELEQLIPRLDLASLATTDSRLVPHDPGLAEQEEAPRSPWWRPFTPKPNLQTPWWSLPLSHSTVKFEGLPRISPTGGVLPQAPGIPLRLEVLPNALHCFRDGLESGGAARFAFLEDSRGEPDASASPTPSASLPDRKPELLVTLAYDPAADPREPLALQATLEAPRNLELLALAPGETPTAATDLWLRETRGFSHLTPRSPQPSGTSASTPTATPNWPVSRIPLETRETRLSAWFPHRNAEFFDLFLLPDNSRRLEVLFDLPRTGQQPAAANPLTPRVSLRVTEPGLKCVLAAHAVAPSIEAPLASARTNPDPVSLAPPDPALPAGTKRSPADLPPCPVAERFAPLLWLSPHLVANPGQAPFRAHLEFAPKENQVRLRLDTQPAWERWCHVPHYPVLAPLDWGLNDPAASNGLSALRGLLPLEFPAESSITLTPAAGGLDLGVPVNSRVPTEFLGRTLSLSEPATHDHLELVLGSGKDGNPDAQRLRLQRRHAPPTLDFHWSRSLPPHAQEAEVPIEFTRIADHLFPEAKGLGLETLLDESRPSDVFQTLATARPPTERPVSGSFPVQAFTLLLEDGTPLARLLVRFRSADPSQALPPARWTITALDGTDRPTWAGLVLVPLRLTATELTLGLLQPSEAGRSGDEDAPWPFAGPGRITLAFPTPLGPIPHPNLESRVQLRPQSTRVVLSGSFFLRRILGVHELTIAKVVDRLLAVTSDAVSVPAGTTDLAMGELRYWVRITGETFSIRTSQIARLGQNLAPGSSNVEGSSGLECFENGSQLQLRLRQALPAGLWIEEDVLADSAADTPPPPLAPDLGRSPSGLRLCQLGDSGSALEVARARPADGVHEFAAPSPTAEPVRIQLSLADQVPISVNALNRCYLRLRRLPEATPDLAYQILGGFLGWTATRIFGFRPPLLGGAPPQVTLYLPESDVSAPFLLLNGSIEWPVTFAPPQSAELSLRLLFWDGRLPLTWDGLGTLALRPPEGSRSVEVNALLSAALDLPGPTPKWIRWSAFQTVRFDDQLSLQLSGTFALELPPPPSTSAEALFIRRPDSLLRTWPTPIAAPDGPGRSLFVSLDLSSADPRTELKMEQNNYAFDGITHWRDFALEESLRDRTLGDSPGKLPGPHLVSVPTSADPGTSRIRLLGKAESLLKQNGDGFAQCLASSLFHRPASGADSGPLWLRCPVREISHLAPPPASPASLWVWRNDHLEKLWMAGEALPNSTKASWNSEDLENLAAQVLRFSRWHRNAILELRREPPESGVIWKLVDSPLLDRDLDLADFTDTLAPTGNARFPTADPAAAPATTRDPRYPAGTGPGLALASLSNGGLASFRLASQARTVGTGADWKAPFILAEALFDFSSSPGSGRAEIIHSLGRTIPFALDASRPAGAPAPAPAVWFAAPLPPTDPSRRSTLALVAPELRMSLYTPRPGEKVTFELEAGELTGSIAPNQPPTFAAGPRHSLTLRTPCGSNSEVIELLPVTTPPPPKPGSTRNGAPSPRFADHLACHQVRWRRRYPVQLKPTPARPAAVGLIAPDPSLRRVQAGESFPITVALAASSLRAQLDQQAVYLVIAPSSPTNPIAIYHFDFRVLGTDDPTLAADTPASLQGPALALPVWIPRPEDPTGEFRTAAFQVAIRRADGAPIKEPVSWKVWVLPLPLESGTARPRAGSFPVDPSMATIPEQLTFELGGPPPPKVLPALLTLIRNPGTARARTAAFGTESTTSWSPSVDPASGILAWHKAGAFDDFVPNDAPTPTYRLSVLLADGSQVFAWSNPPIG